MVSITNLQHADALGKGVNSTLAAVTTIFLFSRLWARVSHHRGLWWDDYILNAAWALSLIGNGLNAAAVPMGFNVLTGSTSGFVAIQAGMVVTFLAIALSKTAFAITLLRITSGWNRAVLWFLIVTINVVTVAACLITWTDPCNKPFDVPGFGGRCVSIKTRSLVFTIFFSYSIFAHFVLGVYPWKIVRKLDMTKQEKLEVSAVMSLVGLAGIVAIAKVVFMTAMPADGFGTIDYTYDLVLTLCLNQAEVSVSVIAQTIPVLRVLIQNWGQPMSRVSSRSAGSARDIPRVQSGEAKSKTATAGRQGVVGPSTMMVTDDIELVALPSGKIVPKDSEEAKNHQGMEGSGMVKKTSNVARTPVAQRQVTGTAQTPRRGARRVSELGRDDVHRVWSALGLSTKVVGTLN